VSSTTGLISGTPTVAGNSSVTIGATNAEGTGNATLNISIAPAPVQPPAITSTTSANGTVGVAFSYQVIASNNATSFAATGLPAGLSIDATSGLISGTPTAAGNSSVTLSATNSGGTGNATLNISITTANLPVITSLLSVNATTGKSFSYRIRATNKPVGFGATGLPNGFKFNAKTGVISGKPTSPSVVTVFISASNASGTSSATLSIQVLPVRPKITSVRAVRSNVGTDFTLQVTASNAPTIFGASGLPAGLSINSATGLISGTPTAAGNYVVSLTATNAGGTGNSKFKLQVLPPRPLITNPISTDATLYETFTYQITASNSPTKFGAKGLPKGLKINTKTGLISGKPTVLGNFSVTLSATNAGGTSNATLSLRIVPRP
jgi:PKD repeat protein